MNIQWLKLDVNILDDTKIKIIRKYPDGDKLFVLWIGLLCMAMKSDLAGYIYISEGIPYTPQDIANILELELKTVEMGLALFKKYDMINIIEGGVIEIINFNKHQAIDKLERRRELARKRQEKYRKRQKLLINPKDNNDDDVNNDSVTHNEPVDNDTDKKRIEKNRKDKKKKKEKKKYAEHVSLSEKEYDKLINEYGESKTKKFIQKLNNYKGAKGKKYKSDYRAILNWVVDYFEEKENKHVQKNNITQNSRTSGHISPYSQASIKYDELPKVSRNW